MPSLDSSYVEEIVLGCGLCGLAFAASNFYATKRIGQSGSSEEVPLIGNEKKDAQGVNFDQVDKIAGYIEVGAHAFLREEYNVLAYFVLGFGALLFLLMGYLHSWTSAGCSVIAFVVGALTSILSGYIGMSVAVVANSRTAKMASGNSWHAPFATSFRAGSVMGFGLTGLGLLALLLLVRSFAAYFGTVTEDFEVTQTMFECLAGYGLGGSSIALFGRVGGGIYTKAADVGADQAKIHEGLAEDCPQNPAVIADNVGDNVGDIAGMGADLFGSFAEASCASMVIASRSPELRVDWTCLCFPLILISTGVLVSFVTTFVSTHWYKVKSYENIETSLKLQLIVSTVIMSPVAFFACYLILPASFSTGTITGVSGVSIFYCVMMGLWSGLAIGLTTEYYTSFSYEPVIELANKSDAAATNIIYGLALGYKSVIVPVFCIAATILVTYSQAGMYGISTAALGILSTLATGLAIDAYGPICDNAGGIAEMAGLPGRVREKTDALDAAGNTTAAIGKGFAIASAAFVSLALFGAFVTCVGATTVDILRPYSFAGLLVGAMLPYWFTAMTMKSVGRAAADMCVEVKRQFEANPDLLKAAQAFDLLRDLESACEKAEKAENDGKKFDGGDSRTLRAKYAKERGDWNSAYAGAIPDYQKCIAISTEASLREMIAPGALVMLTPLVTGFFFGVEALAGVLAGSLVSGVPLAISSSNTGGAWDNAKKYIEGGHLCDKTLEYDKYKKYKVNAVIGDTVGDPLKDTSGPSLNILIKLSAIISLVFAPAFPTIADGGWLTRLF